MGPRTVFVVQLSATSNGCSLRSCSSSAKSPTSAASSKARWIAYDHRQTRRRESVQQRGAAGACRRPDEPPGACASGLATGGRGLSSDPTHKPTRPTSDAAALAVS